MAAYIIVDILIKDAVEYEEYKKLTPASIKAFNGKFIVRGGQTETLEGEWLPGRMVVLEFPDVQTAREWWSSDMYAAAKQIRQRSAITNMILVEGISN